jgi:A/G-specific adenine glycosylase
LGYYGRARNLHRAAAMVVSEFDGRFPSSTEDLIRLPGVGRYTAGAVASLAFDMDVPILDGNVIRVFTRLLDIKDDVSQSAVQNRLWKIASDWMPPGRAAHWNEGLMELGREICTPRLPACNSCPVSGFCLSYKHGVQQDRPVKARKKPTPHYDVTAGVIYRPDGRILIAQRPLDGMLGGLWEFPGGKKNEGEKLVDCLKRELVEELGVQVEVGSKIGVVRHAYTHFKITLHAFECHYLGGEPQALDCADWRWVTTEEIEQYAFPVTDQKIWKLAQSERQSGFGWD